MTYSKQFSLSHIFLFPETQYQINFIRITQLFIFIKYIQISKDMIIQLLLLVLSLATLASALIPSRCTEVYYDHYELVLTWPQEYCSENSCKSGWNKTWDGTSFLISGFWPSSQDMAFVACLNDPSGHDPYCYKPYTYDKKQFTKAEQDEMGKYWPNLKNQKSFWTKEWNKHGTCYLHIIKDEFKSSLTNNQIFKKYMYSTVEKLKKLDLYLQSGDKYSSKAELAKELNLHPTEFYALCYNDNELDEIRVCYDIYETPGKEAVDTCPTSIDRSQCQFPIKIK